MFYENETVIMDEGTRVMQDVTVIKYHFLFCIIEDADGDRWEVETQRLTPITHNL